MILYFADRNLNILGQASTHLPKGVRVVDDLKTEDVETGCAIFECDIAYDKKTRAKVNEWTKTGNYILRSSDDEYEVYNIIDREKDTKKQQVYLYAEDDGLDLLNEVVDKFEASEYQPISYYVNLYAVNAGWEIGINELEGITRKLSFDSEQTASARLLSIAEAFNNAEISFSFEIDGLTIKKKKINIYEKRGKDTGEPLRINKEIDSIITTETISNLATALRATGGTPDNAEEPITLLGYKYDDGDFYVDGAVLKSRNAFAKWQRLIKGNQDGGHITKQFSYDTLSQAELCEKAIAELKTICDVEVNYEIDITDFPENVKIGDRANIIDDADELYLSSRVLTLETSVTQNKRSAVFGEHLIRKDGISSKVEKLAADFAKSTKSVERAKNIANNAKEIAEEAKTQAENALTESENAKAAADEAKNAADTATNSANDAKAKAEAAEAAVDKVEESVSGLQTTIDNAQAAADNAQQAAETATEKAEEAKTAAENAQKDAAEAKNNAENAKTAAENAIANANNAISQANKAKTTAENAAATARAAKIDAEQAENDVAALGDNLETLSREMQTEYARKTDLTETEADLKTKIAQNSAKIETTASQVLKIDETANNAFGQAIEAQSQAVAAQQLADEATAYALEAQQAANDAETAAENAQSEADTAKAAAITAQNVATAAKTALETAKADLETVLLRADATEEEIANAKAAVENAQNAADIAKADAEAAETVAINAQNVADKAAAKATEAQATATEAVNNATLAQENAIAAKGNAETAQAAADEAKETAIAAQNTANEAKETAETAQATANTAAKDAETAQNLAEEAANQAAQAEADLTAAENALAEVLAKVDATEKEIATAQNNVAIAQAAADIANEKATAAQTRANEAAEYAEIAQAAAITAKNDADTAQATAAEALIAVEQALGEVGLLEVRTAASETRITQNAEAIKLTATKDEVTQTLGGYYTKEETDAALILKSDEISTTVKKEVTAELEIGGRNLLFDSAGAFIATETDGNYGSGTLWDIGKSTYAHGIKLEASTEYTLSFDYEIEWGECTPITPTASVGIGAVAGAFQADISGGTASYYGNGKYYTKTEGNYPIKGRFYFTFLSPNAETLANKPYFAMRPARTSNATALQHSTFSCSNFKLEKGIIATDWTPAPEDVSADIDTATENANDALIRLEAAETQIKQLADNISMLVQKGDKSSQMVFDENSSTWSFDTGEIDENISQHTTDIENLKESANNASADVEAVKNRLDNFEEHISIGTYEDEPCLTLYENDSNYKQRVTNTRRIITETVDGVEVVKSEVGVDTAQYKKVVAEETSQIGGFAWKKRGTNRIGLVWEGAIK